MAIVYILTNEAMPDTIKVGITENLDRRIRELDNLVPSILEAYDKCNQLLLSKS